MTLSNVAIRAEYLSESVKDFAKQFHLAVNPTDSDSFDFILEEQQQGWQLLTPDRLQLKIDFDTNKMDYQRKNISRNNILARAVGLKKPGLRILDLTAGLAIDAVHMTQLGCQVVSLERNPLLFFLLQQAQSKTAQIEIKNIDFRWLEAQQFLLEQGSKLKKNFDVIYYDPMYPEKKKSALPRKEMQAFRQLVGEDADTETVKQLCLQSKIDRFVMKRPLRVAEIEKTVQGFNVHVLKGTTIQYQIYIRGKVNE